MNLQRVARALEYSGGTHTVGDIVDGVMAGDYKVLENDTATLVIEQQLYPRLARINIFLAAGDLSGVIELGQQVIDYAKEIGCEVSLYGRKGWTRVLKSHGFQEAHTVMTWRPT